MDSLANLNPAINYLSEDEPDFTQSKKLKVGNLSKNATDFSDVKTLIQEDYKKFVVEISAEEFKEIQTVEDVPNYLYLLLVKLKNVTLPSQPGVQASGISMLGSAPTQITTDYIESLNSQGQAELKEKLHEKL